MHFSNIVIQCGRELKNQSPRVTEKRKKSLTDALILLDCAVGPGTHVLNKISRIGWKMCSKRDPILPVSHQPKRAWGGVDRTQIPPMGRQGCPRRSIRCPRWPQEYQKGDQNELKGTEIVWTLKKNGVQKQKKVSHTHALKANVKI